MKQFLPRMLFAALLFLPACSIGSSRTFDTRQDLSGLDIAYMQSRVTAEHSQNTQSVEGELSGWPFWFVPGVTVHARGANALYRGEVEPRDPEDAALSKITGYTHNDLSALGLGLLAYQADGATWDYEGSLESWEQNSGLGWGLVYKSKEWGDRTGRQGISGQLLAGLLGYSEDQGRGYLSLLWIPIPVRW